MRLEIHQINQAWQIIDVDVPGWRTVEQHGERGRAEARLAALLAAQEADAQPRPAPQAEDSPAPEAALTDPVIVAILETGSAADVVERIEATTDADTLDALRDAEKAGAGRRKVLQAIRRRMGEVGA